MTDSTGFLNLNKPAALTSHDCVAVVRRILNTRKVGHGGTLDPDATGVLPIAVGQATRFLSFLPEGKGYRATFRLGQSSTTDDASGEILVDHPHAPITLEQVKAGLDRLRGQIQQIPPIYSAIRQGGKRLYELAREGVTPDQIHIPPRTVEIYSLTLLEWRPGPYPELDLEIECGPGTYIRALARDLGHDLGCGGLMSRLIRWRSGAFPIETSVPLQILKEHPEPSSLLHPIESGFSHLSLCRLDPEQTWRWCCGQILPWSGVDPHGESDLDPIPVRVQAAESGQFLGLGQIQQGQLKVLRVLGSGGAEQRSRSAIQ